VIGLVGAVGGWGAALAAPGDPPAVALPADAGRSAWQAPLDAAGLRMAGPAERGAVEVSDLGRQWEVRVEGGASQTVPEPVDADQRQDLAWLIAGLVRPAGVGRGDLPVPPPPGLGGGGAELALAVGGARPALVLPLPPPPRAPQPRAPAEEPVLLAAVAGPEAMAEPEPVLAPQPLPDAALERVAAVLEDPGAVLASSPEGPVRGALGLPHPGSTQAGPGSPAPGPLGPGSPAPGPLGGLRPAPALVALAEIGVSVGAPNLRVRASGRWDPGRDLPSAGAFVDAAPPTSRATIGAGLRETALSFGATAAWEAELVGVELSFGADVLRFAHTPTGLSQTTALPAAQAALSGPGFLGGALRPIARARLGVGGVAVLADEGVYTRSWPVNVDLAVQGRIRSQGPDR
jgi:hypothetical protein